MKLKYHKIKNTPLDICTAEAVIAYNYAFSNGDLFKRRYSACSRIIFNYCTAPPFYGVGEK